MLTKNKHVELADLHKVYHYPYSFKVWIFLMFSCIESRFVLGIFAAWFLIDFFWSHPLTQYPNCISQVLNQALIQILFFKFLKINIPWKHL